jgi:hypothetical protein
MNRRTLLTTVATVSIATAGCVGESSSQEEQEEQEPDRPEGIDTSKLPDDVSDSVPLLESFAVDISQYYPDSRVYISRDAEIYFEYTSSKSTANELKTEIHQIADVYINSAEGHEARTLTILTLGVKAVVPQVTAQKRLDGNLEKDAFHETIGLLSRENVNSN